jgi:hypothetical protein
MQKQPQESAMWVKIVAPWKREKYNAEATTRECNVGKNSITLEEREILDHGKEV